jgi:Xaa-Pro dipeptidase
MSGSHSADAGGSYARTDARRLETGDAVLVHCNSYVNGYWTDITRTFFLGEPSSRRRELQDAVLAARIAALATVRSGTPAREVDRSARDVLSARGLGAAFTHGTGHGVGFAAIDHTAVPRLHPVSPDVLEAGMVFNVEPAVYLAGECGVRHCDIVVATERGAELLTPFPAEADALALGPHPLTTR